jgi:DNA-binding transcriptional MerR regulator
MPDILTIGALAARAGVTADTIRYYERLALLPRPARSAAGYRQYPPAAVNRLQLIRNAQQFGFSLRQIAGFLRVRDAGGKPCHDVRAAAERVLAEIDRQIAGLIRTRRRMRHTLRIWDGKLAATPAGRRALLLETPPWRVTQV